MPFSAGVGAASAATSTFSESVRARRWEYLKSPFLGAEYQRRLTIGKIFVRVVEAAHLPAADLGGTSDPYVKLTVVSGEMESSPWRTSVVKKQLNPLFHQDTEFLISRYDAILRVQVYDQDAQFSDDLLGSIDIPLADLAGRGLVKNWFLLIEEENVRSSCNSAAIHLHLCYDVSPLGEAASMLWYAQPAIAGSPKFDVNKMVLHVTNLQQELQPYLGVLSSFSNALTWVIPPISRRWLLVCFLLGCFIEYAFEILHLSLALLITRNLFQKLRTDKVKRQAAEIFHRIDRDGSCSLDRFEIGRAAKALAIKSNRTPPSDQEIDEFFEAADLDKTGQLNLDEFTQMLLASPAIMGIHAIKFSIEYQDPVSTEDEEEKSFLRQTQLRDPSSPRLLNLSRCSSSMFSFGKKKKQRAVLNPPRVEESPDTSPPPSPCCSVTSTTSISNGPPAVKGVAKKVINMAGRKVGPVLADGVAHIGSAASVMASVRSTFMWEDDYKLSGMVAIANFCMAIAHYLLPLNWFVVPAILAIFFAHSEKRHALDMIATQGLAAVRRYRWHLSTDKGPLATLFKSRTRPVRKAFVDNGLCRGSACRNKAFKSVVHGIFSRLDKDGSGMIDKDEFCTFVLEALPAATPRVKEALGGDEVTVIRRVTKLFSKFDENGDGGIDFNEFTNLITKTGTIEVLVQEELSRQLNSENGLKCIKVPARKTRRVLGSHNTSLVATPIQLASPRHASTEKKTYNLSYTGKNGTVHVITPHCLVDIKAGPTKRLLWILYRKYDSARVTVLTLSVSETLRDPLIDLLRTTVQLPLDNDIPRPRVASREISDLANDAQIIPIA